MLNIGIHLTAPKIITAFRNHPDPAGHPSEGGELGNHSNELILQGLGVSKKLSHYYDVF